MIEIKGLPFVASVALPFMYLLYYFVTLEHTFSPGQYIGTFSVQYGTAWQKDIAKCVKHHIGKLSTKVCSPL